MSITTTRSFFYSLRTPLALAKTGSGTVAGATNTQRLELGRNFTLTAKYVVVSVVGQVVVGRQDLAVGAPFDDAGDIDEPEGGGHQLLGDDVLADPGEAVVAARRVTDALDDIIDTSDVRPLDVYAVISVRGTLTDYLPTTLRSYLAVDENMRDTPRPSGRSPKESLLEQIAALESSASSVLLAARNQDADALLTQGSFLRTKFSGSDLDL